MFLDRMLALDLCSVSENDLTSFVVFEAYGAAGHAVEVLLALDIDIGAIGRAQLHIEGSWEEVISASV